VKANNKTNVKRTVNTPAGSERTAPETKEDEGRVMDRGEESLADFCCKLG
jgi:hypothetical protein